ncbi:hypothetical protein OEZ85_009121 [Tetradesmus obliquus]|uniref:F-box domain-containing protein n=1 Tax=Tetradesmus obliquus TaxID=3088 RepID=A0ABY8TKV8_TETOB|nr:hypothetical protein OEZ85_009121 [Tetradesmus obliquus]
MHMEDIAVHVALEASQAPDWGHLPAVAVQALGQRCCPASRAKLRQVCSSWHNALASQLADVLIGPGSPWHGTANAMEEDGDAAAAAATEQRVAAMRRAFPAASMLHVTASSTRDYPATYTQDLARLLSGLPGVTSLSLQELHELEDFDNLDPASLWDALEAALPCLGERLVSLSVADCFWNDPGLFGVLRHLSALTQLRLANNPLETACEVGIIASLSQLRVLEFGLIFDGASAHHDVPRALEAVGDLQQLQELSLPMWRRSLGGRAHPLAPALSAALGRLTQLTSLAVDGKFGHLRVVSCLTNLRRLASAAPLSVEGWEAISQLPQLTLLTSLTPPSEPLRLNPARPHPGLDLGLLATRGSLAGLDVGLMQPEHLATLGQFTRLQRLSLRCAATFQQPRQQAQLLTALSCLPGSLASLQLGPMLPLSAKLLLTIAHSCPGLQSLTARFTHVAGPAAAASLAAAAGALDAAPVLYAPGAAAVDTGLDGSAGLGEEEDMDLLAADPAVFGSDGRNAAAAILDARMSDAAATADLQHTTDSRAAAAGIAAAGAAEWHLHPHQLWGLVRAGCFAGDAGNAAADDSSSSSSSNSITQQQQVQQPGSSSSQLQHASQLLNLRHLYVANRPAAFSAAFPSVKELRPGEAVTCLPLHHRPSVAALLAQLQAGLQQLPALRQLLLYLGHVAKQQSDLPDSCGDELWTEAGERLLEVMPACRVKHYKPSLVVSGGGETAGLAAVAVEEDEGAAAYVEDGGMEYVI